MSAARSDASPEPAPWLLTLRLALFEITPHNANELYELDADPRVMLYIGSGRISTREQIDAVMRRLPRAYALFPGLGTWDLETPDEETRTRGADARVSVKKVFGGGLRRVRWGHAAADPAVPASLGPGESMSYEAVIDARGLPPGDYEVRVEYFGLAETLRSNPARLLIR